MYFYTVAGCLLSALLTSLICLNARALASRFGLMDRPDGARKLHARPTPLIGGLAIILPSTLLAVAYLAWVQAERTLGIAVGAMAATALLGVLDDRAGLAVSKRLGVLAGIIVFACMLDPAFVLHTLRLNLLNVEFSLDPIATVATVFIVIGFVNAANLADGINGQFLGSIFVWCSFILVYAPSERTPFLVLLSSIAAALLFNLRGKLFSGSVGSYALSLFIGLSTIALYRRSGGAFHAEVPVYWFWLPVVDCLRLFIWRMLHNRSPFSADRSHIHHVLARLVGIKKALPIYLLLLALPGALAIFNEHAGLAGLAICGAMYLLVLSVERLRAAHRVLAIKYVQNA
jgi:UDP-GlcNAc:undecaprenyl-phosphate GlcNAc-1-phosphate transferase